MSVNRTPKGIKVRFGVDTVYGVRKKIPPLVQYLATSNRLGLRTSKIIRAIVVRNSVNVTPVTFKFFLQFHTLSLNDTSQNLSTTPRGLSESVRTKREQRLMELGVIAGILR